MRGRLINPFYAELEPLNTAATGADPDSTGPLTSGYDDDFKEPVQIPDDTQVGEDARLEGPTLMIACQVEDGFNEQLRILMAGNAPQSRIVLVFHYKDLEAAALIDDLDGSAAVKINARLVAFRDFDTQDLIQKIPDKPGLYAEQAIPASFGLGRKRNLLLVTFVQRDQAEQAGG